MSLGKRKRIDDDEEPANTGCKRPKLFTTYPFLSSPTMYQSINLFSVIHIPAPKPPLLDLFRLPAELRDQILQYAYGNQAVHVGIKSLNKLAQASYTDLTYTVDLETTCPFRGTPLQLPPLVSRRFYSEATAAFYASSTFSFTEPHCFRAFALSPYACVSRLRHLKISRLTFHWYSTLVASLIGRLMNLRGVKLTYKYTTHSSEYRPVPCAADARWKDLWRIIRAFRQHDLDPPHTWFKVVVYVGQMELGGLWKGNVLRPGDTSYEDMMRLQKDLTDGILEYSPRRLSRRMADKRKTDLWSNR